MDVMQIVKEEFPLTKVIMVSNFADPMVRSYCERAGADAFFDKSHDLSALSAYLKDIRDSGTDDVGNAPLPAASLIARDVLTKYLRPK